MTDHASPSLATQAEFPEEEETSLLDLLQVVVDNLRLLLLGPLLVGLVALGVSFLLTPSFTATNKFMPPQQQQSAAASMLQSLGALGGLAAGAAGLKSPADQYVAFLKTRTIQDALIDRFDLMTRYESKLKQDARKDMDRLSRISTGKDGLITIEYDDKDPKVAAEIANAYVEELGKLLNRLAVTEAQQRRLFFEKQLVTAKDNLAKAEQALGSSGVNSSALKASPQAAMDVLARTRAQITAQEVKIASMRGYLTDSSPELKQAQLELSALRVQQSRAEAQDNSGSGGNSDYVARYRDFKYYETLFDLFAKQYEMAKVDESREGAVIQVVDPAVPPERKSKPQKALIAVIATLGAGFLLLLWVFLRQALRNAEHAPESAQRLAQLRTSWRRALGRC